MWSETNYCNGLNYTFPTPLDAQDRACRDINVLLLTDGEDSCNGGASTAAEAAASDLLNNGVTLGGTTWPVRTHVINFGGNLASSNAIAAAGGTNTALSATNEVELAQALANIVASAVQPEVCDNGDNNCNGCTDEGYKHYCNEAQTCCAWTTAGQRDTCLSNYEASVVTSPPDGDLSLLPCITAGQQADPSTWLCYNPGDICDEQDNNCQDGTDEGQLKCGNPATCPSSEVCDGQDNDCDGQTDEDNVCGSCTPSPEVCDGCDNDCDGFVDNGGPFADLPCGLPSPPNCDGVRTCQAPQAVSVGTCLPGAGYGACNNDPQTEICDGIDNDCDGAVDEGFVSAACEPPGNTGGLVYDDVDPFSVCQKGATACIGGVVECIGGTGPGTVELCNGLDDDCDGFIDALDPDTAVFGVGQNCGVNNPPCTPGTTACVNGALVCQGGTPPDPEVCDGIDNDCDGNIDEAPLADAPASPGCWSLPGTCCSQPNVVGPALEWCPPTGANCSDAGTLSAPCNVGTLQCNGTGGWICVGPVEPQSEVCDNIDNDCNMVVDDGTLAGEGQACGIATPPCQEGLTQCVMGSLDCVGDIGPSQEICDATDNDCDGEIDEGVPNQGACTPSFDMTLFPNSDPSLAPCQPGQLECNPVTGMFECQGGVGPVAEICDGIDNDCDSNIDELGAAPDGIDGSANPFPPPAGNIGDVCGLSEGACEPGNYACLNGLFACLGGQGPVVETCDCEDNDCDGLEDELPDPGEPVLCSPGKDCIKAPGFCQCAAPCSSGEYPCPPGQVCQLVEIQSSGVSGLYCITDYEQQCGDCTTKTVEDGNQNVVCAPAGTDPPGCLDTPECECKGPSGCREPCFNVQCSTGEVCSNFGPTPGECVADICYQTGCPGCNKACHDGACVDNPCQPDTCPSDQVAKPSADFSSCECVPSCADVTCASGEQCVDGECLAWCDPPCTGDQVCDPATKTCVDSQCDDTSCPDGSYCDPLTGMCGDDPCTGVICPEGQECNDGSCGSSETGEGGGGQGGSTNATGGSSSSSGSGGDEARGVFGLPTGGGGCACEVGRSSGGNGAWLLLLLGAAAMRRRGKMRGEEAVR